MLELKKRRFTTDEYHRMGRAGILGEDDRVELVEGEIVEMTPIGPRHADCVALLVQHFGRAFGNAARIWPQNPIRLGEHSEPQPDVALLRPRSYASAHPTPDDILLLVEVAASSAEPDRRAKVPLYARSGIPEVWLVDLEQETVTVYRDPTAEGYRTLRVARTGEDVAAGAFPDQPIAVADLLPRF